MVFDPRRRPWIQLQYADPAMVTAQVDQCPSGALTWAPEQDSAAEQD